MIQYMGRFALTSEAKTPWRCKRSEQQRAEPQTAFRPNPEVPCHVFKDVARPTSVWFLDGLAVRQETSPLRFIRLSVRRLVVRRISSEHAVGNEDGQGTVRRHCLRAIKIG